MIKVITASEENGFEINRTSYKTMEEAKADLKEMAQDYDVELNEDGTYFHDCNEQGYEVVGGIVTDAEESKELTEEIRWCRKMIFDC